MAKPSIFALTKRKEDLLTGGCGVIGSHARLRIWCREAWGFESLHPHQISKSNFRNFFMRK